MAFHATYRNRKKGTVGKKRDRKTNSADKLIHASIANHYNSDRLDRVHVTAQSKCGVSKSVTEKSTLNKDISLSDSIFKI
jgi:hypothetical protein